MKVSDKLQVPTASAPGKEFTLIVNFLANCSCDHIRDITSEVFGLTQLSVCEDGREQRLPICRINSAVGVSLKFSIAPQRVPLNKRWLQVWVSEHLFPLVNCCFICGLITYMRRSFVEGSSWLLGDNTSLLVLVFTAVEVAPVKKPHTHCKLRCSTFHYCYVNVKDKYAVRGTA